MTSYLTLIFIFIFIHNTIGAEVLNCPQNQIKFQKLIGLRPVLNQKNKLLYRSNHNAPVTLECIQSCVKDTNCLSFILYYNKSECYSYSEPVPKLQNYDYDSKPDSNVVWFRKTCSDAKRCDKAWSFEVVSGADFIGQDKKIVGNVTRDECINSCVEEDVFTCRSIRFYNMDTSNVNSVGLCSLSDTDRHLVPSSFRVSRYENEYIENQCINASKKDYCTYEEYDNATLKHADVLLSDLNEEQCREECNTLPTFNCRAYSVTTMRRNNRVINQCYLHSEDTKLAGPKLLINNPNGKYFERVRCLNVSASCTDQSMTITYVPEQKFSGRIYTNGFSDTSPCFAEGYNNENVVLEIPLGSDNCGLVEEQLKNKRIIRTVFLVIQYNSLIQTQADRYIRIGCAEGEENNEVTLGTNINITNNHPNKGSTIISNSTVLPKVTIKVVDYETKQPTKNTEIGQELQLIIDIKPANGPYDIWAGHLIATSDNGADSILLLDDNGCPTQPEIFPQFSKITTNDSRMLVSTFQAFKFTSSPVVRFSVMVHFCTLACPEMNCKENRRIRREIESFGSEATVTPINKTNSSHIEVMPLNVLLIVRGSIGKSDELILGDHKILIADRDWFINEVCVDYALFVGLAVCWIILQIIILVACFLMIRKYKKYFDIAYTRHLDEQQFSETHQGFGLGGEHLSRRVRWADQ